jgi:hypothetical protein
VHRLPRVVLRKRIHYHTSTKFRFGVIEPTNFSNGLHYSAILKRVFFKTTVTRTLTTVRGDEGHATTTLLPPLQLGITVTAPICITAAHCRQSTNLSNDPRSCPAHLILLDLFTLLIFRGGGGGKLQGLDLKSNGASSNVVSGTYHGFLVVLSCVV